MDVISNFAARFERSREEELSIEEYLAECRRNPVAYATAAERMLKAIGEPKMVDTRNDPRLSRIFANKVIKIYPAFAEFYGMEDAIEQVVSYFRHAARYSWIDSSSSRLRSKRAAKLLITSMLISCAMRRRRNIHSHRLGKF